MNLMGTLIEANITLTLELLASIFTLAQIYLYGQKTWWGPFIGLIAVGIFWVYVIYAQAWGFIPLQVATTFLHAYNLHKWIRNP